MSPSRSLFILTAAALLLAACEQSPTADPGTDGVVASMEIVSGQDQEGPWGEELEGPLVVQVLDSHGHGVRNQLVNFRVVQGDGSMWAGSAMSDRQGFAQDYWTLGLPGEQVVEARAVDPTTGSKITFATFRALATGEVPPPPSSEDQDGDGYTVDEGDCADTNPAVHPGAVDRPDDLLLDSNCDGVDGDLALAVLVSATTGSDALSCGSAGGPCLTVTFGIIQAEAQSKTQVYVADGSYDEGVVLADGVSLYGGYDAVFSERNPAQFTSAIVGSTPYGAGGEPATMVASALTIPMEIMDLEIRGVDAGGTATSGRGKNSFAMIVKDVGAGILTIRTTTVIAGAGSAGRAGFAGTPAPQVSAPSGGSGGSGATLATACNNSMRGQGGAGAGSGLLAGGDGGSGGTADTDCNLFSLDYDATSGLVGSNAAVSQIGVFGRGGTGGNWATCAGGGNGLDGRTGSDGANGSGGAGQSIASDTWQGGVGGSGKVGSDGGGGGGGGGAGGCDTGTDSYGAGGGGGGAGGTRALAGGQGGLPGGGSFGIFVLNASVRVELSSFERGTGGDGGRGGNGAYGQPGGAGGPGGVAGDPDAAAGGNGGDGGRGGNAGAGGGGTGGIAVGIYHAGTGSVDEENNTFTGGTGGLGGAGGVLGTTSGLSGVDGQVFTVYIL